MLKAYLFLYNVAQCIGWGYLTWLAIASWLESDASWWSNDTLWKSVGPSLRLFQTSAGIMEFLHASVGFVRSNPMTVLVQMTSRVMLTMGVASISNDAQVSVSILLAMVLAWGITEVVRYAHYAASDIASFYPLLWARYTFFYILYPVGASAEALLLYQALDEFRQSQTGFAFALPNRLNFSFCYADVCVIMIAMYPFLFPKMYLHMIHQRRKYLSSTTKSDPVDHVARMKPPKEAILKDAKKHRQRGPRRRAPSREKIQR